MLGAGITALLRGGAQAGKAAASGIRALTRPTPKAADMTSLKDATSMSIRNMLGEKNFDGVVEMYRNIGALDGQGMSKGFQNLTNKEQLELMRLIQDITIKNPIPKELKNKGINKKMLKNVFSTLEAEYFASRPLRLVDADTGLPLNPKPGMGKVVPFRPKKAEGGLMTLEDLL
jgi:hypothetical protein